MAEDVLQPLLEEQDTVTTGVVTRKRKRRLRPWVYVLLVVLVLAIAGGVSFFLLQNNQPSIQYQQTALSTGNLAVTTSATGAVTPNAQYDMDFTTSGRVTSIDVQVGQHVKAGQVLASLDSTSLQDAVKQQQAAVTTDQNALAEAQASLTTTQAQSSTSVAQAQASLNDAKSTLTSTQAQSQTSLTAAQAALQEAQTSLTNTQAQSQASINSTQSALTLAQTALRNAKNTARQDIAVAYDQEQQAINNCNNQTTPVPNCVQLAQNQYAQAVSTANASVTNAQATVTNDQLALSTAQTNATANNDAAQAKVTDAQNSLATAQASANANDTSAQNKITDAQKALDSAKASASATNLSAQTKIDDAQQTLNAALVQLQTVEDNLQGASLIAPADATVAAINGNVGQSTTAGGTSTSSFMTLTDTTKLGITTQVNEADIASLRVGQPASFTVAAYPNQKFEASVSAVQTLGQTTSNVVSYTVNMAVDVNSLKSAHLYPGMTATVNVTTAQRLDVLLIPNTALSFPSRAIQNGELTVDRSTLGSLLGGQGGTGTASSGTSKLVVKLVNGKLTPVLITVGLTNGQYTEVLTGLKDGDQVVTGQTGGNSTTSPTTPSRFPGAGGGGGGGGGGGTIRSIGGG